MFHTWQYTFSCDSPSIDLIKLDARHCCWKVSSSEANPHLKIGKTICWGNACFSANIQFLCENALSLRECLGRYEWPTRFFARARCVGLRGEAVPAPRDRLWALEAARQPRFVVPVPDLTGRGRKRSLSRLASIAKCVQTFR